MRALIKKLIPKFVFKVYHLVLAKFSAFWYGYPSRKMVVIGVTGTKGKSTTSYFIAKILEEAGFKVGLTSTAMFKINEKEWLNKEKMTMLGRFSLQKLLKKMVSSGCKYAVVETSSEGILQYRHRGIDYDYAVFTNLTPEHLESHGGFLNYKKAKGELFKNLEKSFRKKIGGREISKVIIANLDSEHAKYFLSFGADGKIGYGIGNKEAEISAENLSLEPLASEFEVDKIKMRLEIPGKMNVYNALAAIAAVKAQRVGLKTIKSALAKIKFVPGRMEFIREGQDFKVIVDYAHEIESFKNLYETVGKIFHNKIIHVFGATGGGRDKSRRPKMGEISSERANLVVLTTDDPYDENPDKIIEDVFEGVKEKNRNKVLKITDRREAIKKALEKAEKNDIILITGKGAEQAMALANGKKIPWDDRKIAREFLNNF